MPTGYTAKLCEEGQTFEEFVWRCAKSRGAFVHMRDERLDAPIQMPGGGKEEEYSTVRHHQERLAEELKKLEEIKNLSEEEILHRIDVANREAVDYYEKRLVVTTAIKKRLQDMVDQVTAWQPPSNEHMSLKEFMLEQLAISKDDGDPPTDPELSDDPQKWRQAKIESAGWSINYHTKNGTKATESSDDTCGWIQKLMDSVPIPDSMKPRT